MSLNSDWCFQYYAFGKTKKDRICLNHVTWIAWNVKHNLGVCSKYRPCILDSWSEGGSRSAHNTHVRVSRVSDGIQILNCFSNMKSENCGPWRVNQWSPRWRTRTSEDPRTSKSYFPRAPIIKIKVSGAFSKEDDKKHREVMNPAEFSFISSVRSSYSHPDLLLITPLFQITPVLNTGLSLSEPLQLYKGYNAI